MVSPDFSEPAASVDLRLAYQGQPVLIAGADGFLGVNTAAALHALGAQVTLLSRRETPRAAVWGQRWIKADLRDAPAVAAAVEGHAFVFDLAGSAGAVGSNRDPGGSTDLECRPHLTLFSAAAEAASKPVVAFCSSRLVYGRPQRLPVDEQHPLHPGSFYAVHKLTLEHYLRVLSATRGLRSCIFRLSNPYGPHWPAEVKSYGLINQLIARALAHIPLEIFGQGTQRRDYIHVDDFVTAMLTATAGPHCWGETFNVGGTEPISIRDAALAIAAALPDTKINYLPWPAEYLAVETGDYQSDITKLHRFLKVPDHLSFRQGLARTLIAVREGLPRVASD